MTWSKIRNELERIQLGHFSVNKNEVHKSTELTVKQLEILSKLKVETTSDLLRNPAKHLVTRSQSSQAL